MKPRLDTVLAYVNMARKQMKLRALRKLPKGETHNESKCPLARALGVRCTRVSVKGSQRKRNALEIAWLGVPQMHFIGLDNELGLPLVLADFVEAFDEGRYPALEQK